MTTDFTWKTTMQARGQWSNIKGIIRKGNFRPISLINIHEKKLILANRVQQYIENLIYHNQERFTSQNARLVNISESISIIYHINILKIKSL